MARFFVCSDIHGAESRLEMYLANQSGIDTVIVCGDLNVAHAEIDIKNPKTTVYFPVDRHPLRSWKL